MRGARTVRQRTGLSLGKVYSDDRRSQTEFRLTLAAQPVDGAANEALVRFLAERLGVPRAAVTVVGGATGRRKRVAIVGIERERVLGVA